jgi:hypothetical protein
MREESVFKILAIGWTGQAFSGEQMLALRTAAVKHELSSSKASAFDFRHETCEGRITRGKVGSYVGFGGTFFHADLGTISGERWTIDYLIPTNSMYVDIDADDVVLCSRVVSTHAGLDIVTEEVSVTRSNAIWEYEPTAPGSSARN